MQQNTLYRKSYEHDNCGVGFIADINGEESHQIITNGLVILEKLEHRGASAGAEKVGDGAGIMAGIPHSLFSEAAKKNNKVLPDAGNYGVGMFFLPSDNEEIKNIKYDIEASVSDEKGEILFWRDVPVDPSVLSETARKSMPVIKQLFVSFSKLKGEALEKKLLYAQAYNRKKDLSPFFHRSVLYTLFFVKYYCI